MSYWEAFKEGAIEGAKNKPLSIGSFIVGIIIGLFFL